MTVYQTTTVIRAYLDEKRAQDFCELARDTVMGYQHAFTDYDTEHSENNKNQVEERLQTLASLLIFNVTLSKEHSFTVKKIGVWEN